MSDQIFDALINLAGTILLGLLSVATVYASMYLQKLKDKAILEAEKIEDDGFRNMAMDAMDELHILVDKTVRSIEQTTAKALRESVKAAKDANRNEEAVTLETQLHYQADVAFEDIKSILSNTTLDVLTEIVDDVDGYIRHCIEAKVLEVKDEQGLLIEQIAETVIEPPV